jgi:dipeptidyl aminopeptidase/acylaminoacyl peptidase
MVLRALTAGILVLSTLSSATAQPVDEVSPQQRGGRPPRAPGVYRDRVEPHWFANDAKFWYKNDLKERTKEFILVDAEKGTRGPAFDHAKLAAALSKATGEKYEADKLPFDAIDFVEEGKAVKFAAKGKLWQCSLDDYICSESKLGKDKVAEATKSVAEGVRSALQGRRGFRGAFRRNDADAESPDKKWTAFIKEGNVHVRSADGKQSSALSKEGTTAASFGMLHWSPDSNRLVAWRIEPGERKEVHLIESSPKGGGRAVHSSRPYPLPGDRFDAHELWTFEVGAKSGKKVDVERVDFGRPNIRWRKDGKQFTYEKVDRGHQRFRLVEVNAETGKSRNLIDEKSNTFIWTAHAENVGVPLVTWLEKTDEILYSSERSGWRRLHLIDANTGAEKNVVTPEGSVLRGVEKIDEENRQIWFRACGLAKDQDPYFIHSYRADFDGKNLVALTDGDGTHTVQFSPTRKYLVDTFSRVDKAPATQLRSAESGKLICKLEDADIAELKSRGWTPLEPFVAKGRDGKTDIWGVVQKPKNFDPKKKYPVIESIYAGPQGSFVPKAFSAFNRYALMSDLGFVVVQIDGMGTANRSKAFHDVCWKNIKDAGFPDRILWHKAFATKNPWYDVSRVGVYGTSAGGQNAMGAVLFHGDFYKAAMAACGCHDNRMDKASWNEQWMGFPVGSHYAECSNVDNAKRLAGKLLLIVGEMDNNVPPESTLRVVDALIKANKDFDFLLVPGLGHSDGGPYGRRKMQEFFKRHLMNGEGKSSDAVATSAGG